MDRPLYLLIAQNSPEIASSFTEFLPPPQFRIEFVTTMEDCTRSAGRRATPCDLILVDESLPPSGAVEALRRLRSIRPETPTALMSAALRPKLMYEASEAGARGFLNKPAQAGDVEELVVTLCPQIADPKPETDASVHTEDLGAGQFFLASSPAMLTILKQVRQLSRADVPVLITGESGVGKEVVAMLIHKYSLRANRTLLKVNCAALPNDLLESELFGYEAGAFTGAARAKPGKFDICDKGTILLDEIGEMSPQLQAKLLHVLQDGTFSRLGSRVNTKVDVRVLAATNVNIEQAIEEKKFREDLYYRLNAFILRVPPLRERTEEIPWLLRNLAAKLAEANGLEPIQFSARMVAAAMKYQWPGNLRELGNFVKRYLIMRDETAALVELESKLVTRTPSFSAESYSNVRVITPGSTGLKSAVRSNKDETESRIIRDVLEEVRWNRRIAAERLQISYKSLLQKIRYYNLEASA